MNRINNKHDIGILGTLLMISIILNCLMVSALIINARDSTNDRVARIEGLMDIDAVGFKGVVFTQDMTIEHAIQRYNDSGMIGKILLNYGIGYVCDGDYENLVAIAEGSMG